MSTTEPFPVPISVETEPLIVFAGVTKHYGETPILRGIDLQIRPGEKIALMGPSGCGKTTLLRCINALERIDGGRLTVNGHDVNAPDLDINRFRAQIGMVFQQYNLFPHLTVLENIMLAPVTVQKLPADQTRTRAMSLLAQVGIAEKANTYPDELSGGQKQRVAIARSLAMEPVLMLLDEPTSALDPPMSREVLSVIEQVQNMTMIMVTHDLRFVTKIADRLIFLEEGQIVVDGPPGAVLENPSHPGTAQYLETYR